MRFSAHLPSGEQGVRIEFEKDAKDVLLSDFSLWHHVLNYRYLPKSKEDGDRFEEALAKKGLPFHDSRPLPDKRFHRRIEKSWEQIFDLDLEDSWIAQPRQDKSIQAIYGSSMRAK